VSPRSGVGDHPAEIVGLAPLLKLVLESESARQLRALERQRIVHAPTVGRAFENLLQKLLRKFIPSAPNVRLVRGFAKGYGGRLSRELDCMLVVGRGQSVRHADARVYPVDDVLAVISVKKILRARDFIDVHENLKSVVELVPLGGLPFGTHLKAVFEQVTGHAAPSDLTDPNQLPAALFRVYGTIALDVAQPLRIAFGYWGHKSERGIRAAMNRHLEELEGRPGFGPVTLPNLLLTPVAAVIKASGLPWWNGLAVDGSWPLLVSSSVAYCPVRAMLTMISTRLRLRGLIGEAPFAGDTKADPLSPFAAFKWDEQTKAWRWRSC
jgi:hypothetical protein